ncbi:MAG: hypothetical protein FWD06_00885 [Oscillospiraceae bacterium]|nr:hypothetical protein [Oscillospiraceae bacterium]
MKRIFQLALALVLALALMLPVAAIANLDGSDPEWDGYEGIRPMSDVLTIGEPTDEPVDAVDGYFELDDSYEIPERNPLARDANANDELDFIDVPELGGSGIMAISDYLDIEPISAETGHGVPVVLFYVTLGIAVLALVLAIVALVKKK